MLESLFENNVATSAVGIGSLLICSLISLILGFMIALVCKMTSRSTKNFLITVALLPLLVQAVMLMVNGNLGTSIAIMGAFSLVRFRSLPGTSRDILFVFFAMAVGLATGMGQAWFAIALAVLGCLVILLFSQVKVFDRAISEQKLSVIVPENLDYTEIFDDIFADFTSSAMLYKTKTVSMGSMYELTYQVALKNDVSDKDFIDQIRMRNANCKVSLSRELGEGEL